MIEIIKKNINEKIESLEKRFVETQTPCDLLEELDTLHTKIILTSAFGLENISEVRLPYEENGVTTQKSLGMVLRDIFMYLAFRTARYEICVIPFLMFFYYTKSDREALRNIKTVRQFCRDLIEDRKKNPIKDGADLLSILLEDSMYQDQTEVIIDECITFFLAGSQTVKTSNANIIMHLALHKEVKDKVMKELQEKIFAGEPRPIDVRKCFTFEKVQDLTYFSYVFNETLRLEPPVIFSGVNKVTEEITIDDLKIAPTDNIIVNLHQLHHDSEQWIEHDRFIPERFDPNSSYYLTPSGVKRHPLAFCPFFGGKRICIGKTFAEIIAKLVVPGLLSRIEFSFADTSIKEKPLLNVDMVEQPKVLMNLKKA